MSQSKKKPTKYIWYSAAWIAFWLFLPGTWVKDTHGPALAYVLITGFVLMFAPPIYWIRKYRRWIKRNRRVPRAA